jgi:actin-related protein
MAMTDMTEEELRRFAEALANASVSLDKKTAEERAAADKSKAVNDKAFEAVSATADVFVTFGKEAYKGSSASKGAAAATEKMGDAALAAAAALLVLAPGGPIVKSLMAGVALLTKQLFGLGAEIDVQTGEIYKAYQEMARVGASGSKGMQEVFDGLQKVGLGTEKFAAYTKLISESAGDLATFGGTLNKGRKTFENTMESLSQGQREQLEYMGLDREAQAESTLNYIKQQRLLTQGTKEQMNTSSTAVMKYIDETDKLARITGLNRKEQEKLLDDAMRNEAFNATIQDIQEKHGPEAVRRVLEAQAMAAKAGPETRKQFEAALSGFVGSTNEAQQAFMSSGGKMFELTERLRDGQIKNTRDTATSMNEVFNAQGEIAKQFRVQAQMMNFGKSGMGNFYEAIRAGAISLDDLANAYDEADAETKKRDAQTELMARAENDYRRAQLAIQAKLQLGMDISINKTAIAAENLRLAGEYALAWARALKDGKNPEGAPPPAGPVPTTEAARENRETAEINVEKAEAERKEAQRRQDELKIKEKELEEERKKLEKQQGEDAKKKLEAVEQAQKDNAAKIRENREKVQNKRMAEADARREAEIKRALEESARRKKAIEAPFGVPRPAPGQRPNVPGVTPPPPPDKPAATAPAATAPAATAPVTGDAAAALRAQADIDGLNREIARAQKSTSLNEAAKAAQLQILNAELKKAQQQLAISKSASTAPSQGGASAAPAPAAPAAPSAPVGGGAPKAAAPKAAAPKAAAPKAAAPVLAPSVPSGGAPVPPAGGAAPDYSQEGKNTGGGGQEPKKSSGDNEVQGSPRKSTEAAILHHTGGRSISGAVSTLKARGLAYHYMIDRDGNIIPYMADNAVAYHAGDTDKKPEIGNWNTLGIAAVANNNNDVTKEQMKAAIKLNQDLSGKFGYSSQNVFGHGQVTSRKEALEGIALVNAIKNGVKDTNPQAQHGGIFSGPMSGYPVTMHGDEAVIPLKNGKVPVHIDSTNSQSLAGGHNELKGYNAGPMTTDLAMLEKVAGKLGAYDKSTQMITDPKLWKDILQSGMLMNYEFGMAQVGTRDLSSRVGSETVADAIAGRIKELIDTKKDSGEAITQTRTEFADMMKTFYTDVFAKLQVQQQKENPLLNAEILATLKDISRTNAAAAGSSEKMLRYSQN